jgi:hypothetical protein
MPEIFAFWSFFRKKHVWTLGKFNVIFGAFARRHMLWRRGTCCAGTTRTSWRRRGTELGATDLGAELGCISLGLLLFPAPVAVPSGSATALSPPHRRGLCPLVEPSPPSPPASAGTVSSPPRRLTSSLVCRFKDNV